MLTALSIDLIVASVCLLAGAAIGYYSAHADIERKRRDRPE